MWKSKTFLQFSIEIWRLSSLWTRNYAYAGTFLKSSESITRYFFCGHRKQRLNIRTEWELVVLGQKGLWEAAAAHVNNNTALPGCRRSERTNRTDGVLVPGSHQSFGQRVGVFRGQQLPDLPPIPLPVLPLRAVRRHLGLRRWGGVIPPPLQQRGLLSWRRVRGTLCRSKLVVGMVRGRGVAVAEGSGAAVPMLESGVRVGSVSACPWQGFYVELEARLSGWHVRACVHPGHWWVGSALRGARSRLSPLDRRLWPAITVESVKAFLRAPRASLRHVTLGTWTPNKWHMFTGHSRQ